MQATDPKATLEKLGAKSLKIDSYFLRRTGFLATQSTLRLGEYTLNCVPASLGSVESRFLVALTPTEVSLFSKYKDGLHLLMLTFGDPDTNDIARFPLRVGLIDIQPVPERRDICLLSLKMKSMPTEFVLFLGAFIEDLESSMESWEALSSDSFAYSPAMVLSAGLGYGAVLVSGDRKVSVEVIEFSTKRIGIVIREGAVPDSGSTCQVLLTFQGRPLNLQGIYDSGAFLPEFSPDWLDFVQQFRLRRQFLQQKAARQPS